MRFTARLLAVALAAAPLLALLVAPVAAGTQDVPEILDPAADRILDDPTGVVGGLVGSEIANQADLVKVWVEEDADNLYFHIEVSADDLVFPVVTGLTYTIVETVHFTVAGTSVEGTLTIAGGPTGFFGGDPDAGGAATDASENDGVFNLTIPKTALPTSELGTVLEGLHVEAEGEFILSPVGFGVTDTAPDAGELAGITYTISKVPVVPDPFDTDGDGLNDTAFEDHYFGDLNQTGPDDPDADNLNNTAEQALGTDPTKADTDSDGVDDDVEVTDGTDPTEADTDGDGASDGDEKDAGTDPLDASDKPTTSGGNTSGGNTSGGNTSGGNTSGAGGSTSTTSTSKEFADKLKDALDAEYLPIAGAGAGVLILLSLIGRFGRWGL